ncbi:isochorismatase hydrolase-like protein [Acephala macrosclerotiorum]|nr:isochorismatase hydrolase-like protein [Acephala macrosclerotiorum]
MSAKAFRELIGVAQSTASTKDSVLVIIDAQNEYAEGQLKTENVSSTRKQISTLLEKYRAASAPLVHIVHQVPDGAPVFTPETNLAKEFAELEPKSGEKSAGIKKLVLVGYMAHVCVSTTARQAAERGYDVVLVEDAIGDRNIPGVKAEELVKVVLAELADAFGTVLKAADIS